MSDIVDKIINKKIDDGTKLVRLYAVVMTNYRQPLGDKAWEEIGKLFKSPKAITGFSFLTGFIMANGFGANRFEEFIKEELEEIKKESCE